MRWEQLFDDIEAQWQEAERAQMQARVVDQTRAERAQVGWFDRIVASVGSPISCATAAGSVDGVVVDIGKDWLVIDEPGRGAAIVAMGAILSVGGLPRRSDQSNTAARRFGLGVALRGISRDRSAVAVHDLGGTVWVGTIDFVGSDHIEVVLHPADAFRRSDAVTGRRVVPWSAIAVIRRIS